MGVGGFVDECYVESVFFPPQLASRLGEERRGGEREEELFAGLWWSCVTMFSYGGCGEWSGEAGWENREREG